MDAEAPPDLEQTELEMPDFPVAETPPAESPGIELPPAPPVPVDAPESVRTRITVGPVEDWVRKCDVDESCKPDDTEPLLILLFDRQHNAQLHSEYCRTVQKLATIKGVQIASQWQLNFDPATQSVVIHSITVRRPGHETENADVARFRFLRREEKLEKSFFISGYWTVLAVIEDVRVGDILDISYTVNATPRFLAQKYSALFSLSPSARVRAFHMGIRFPEGDPMKWKGSDAFGAPLETRGETVIWNWTLENIKPGKTEENVPSWQLPPYWIHFSNHESWHEVASALADVWPGRREHPNVKSFAQELLEKGGSQAGAARMAIEFVQDEVRYLSVNEDFGGQIPSQPDEVLRRRYGDCKDKSALLAELLRALGLEARPVLVNTHLRDSVKSFLPSPNLFDHAVVEFSLDGKRRWVDATVTMQGGEALERAPAPFGACLPVDEAARDLEEIVPPESNPSSYRIEEVWQLDTARMVGLLSVVCVATGFQADNARRTFSLEDMAAVSRSRERLFRQMFRNVTRAHELKWMDDRKGNRVALAETYEIKNPYGASGNPRAAAFAYGSHLVRSILALPAAKEPRQSALALSQPCKFEHQIEFRSPSLMRRDSTRVNRIAPAFDYSFNGRRLLGRWTWNYTLNLKASSVSAEAFSVHKSDVRAHLALDSAHDHPSPGPHVGRPAIAKTQRLARGASLEQNRGSQRTGCFRRNCQGQAARSP